MKIKCLLLALASCFLFAGCGAGEKEIVIETTSGYLADSSTIIANSDGTITGFIAEDFDEGIYSLPDLQSSIEAEIAEYNSLGEKSVSLTTCESKEGKVYIDLLYSDGEAYSTFNGVQVFYGTVEQAERNGYEFDSLILKNALGEQMPARDIGRDRMVLISADASNLRCLSGIEYCDADDNFLSDYEISVNAEHSLHCAILK